jgi:hypothetical protein
MLDMDDPLEVITAASRYTGAVTTAAEQTSRTVGDVTLPSTDTPGTWSALDGVLADKTRWIKTTVTNATGRSADRADVVLYDTVIGALALGHADKVGGDMVNAVEI